MLPEANRSFLLRNALDLGLGVLDLGAQLADLRRQILGGVGGGGALGLALQGDVALGDGIGGVGGELPDRSNRSR